MNCSFFFEKLCYTASVFLMPNISLSKPLNALGLLRTTIFILDHPYKVSAPAVCGYPGNYEQNGNYYHDDCAGKKSSRYQSKAEGNAQGAVKSLSASHYITVSVKFYLKQQYAALISLYTKLIFL